jgi:hypothetical protein
MIDINLRSMTEAAREADVQLYRILYAHRFGKIPEPPMGKEPQTPSAGPIAGGLSNLAPRGLVNRHRATLASGKNSLQQAMPHDPTSLRAVRVKPGFPLPHSPH